MKKSALFLVLVLAAMPLTGCRRDPAEPKKYYDRELAEMQSRASVKEETYLSDRYPWQGRTRGTGDQLPVRVLSAQAEIDTEIKRLNRVVHGEPKPCCRDRCCWWHKDKCGH